MPKRPHHSPVVPRPLSDACPGPHRLSRRFLAALLLAFVTVHLGLFAVLHAPGHFSIDEVGYHLSTRAFAHGTGFTIWNGYDETPSAELEVRVAETAVARNGRLVGKYPFLQPLLAAPLYPYLGFDSLFLVNAFAFVGVVVITFLIGRRFLGDWTSIAACAVLVGCTYAWEYSQAAWPHALALLFVTLAFYCALRSASSLQARARILWAATAGLSAGVGCGARLDVVFVLGAAGALLLAQSSLRWRELAWLVIGFLPGSLALCVENHFKLGTFWPFAYTTSHGWTRFLPVVGLAAVVVAARLVFWNARAAAALRPHRRVMVLAAILLGLVLLLFAPVRELASGVASGLATLVVDLRLLSPTRREPAMFRTDTGGVMYLGHFKKALLQSCPFAAGAIGAIVLSCRSRGPARHLWTLLIVPAVYVIGYSSSSWHGGLSLNLRYFLPALPFLAILVAFLLRELVVRTSRAWRLGALATAVGVGALYGAFMWPQPLTPRIAEDAVMRVPLLLAAAVAALSLLLLVTRDSLRIRAKGPLLVALAAALVWSSMIAFSYDYRAIRAYRTANASYSLGVGALLPSNSMLVSLMIDRFAGLIDRDRIRLANPLQDDFASFRPLVEYQLEHGRAVWLAWTPKDLEAARALGLLDGFEVRSVRQIGGYAVGELESAATKPRDRVPPPE